MKIKSKHIKLNLPKRMTKMQKITTGGVCISLAAAIGLFVVNMSQASVPSNVTIPDTAYAIPAGATFVATNGNDTTGNGTQGAPYKTIAKSISATASGGTIVFRGGLYRDGTQTTKIFKPLTLQPYPHEQVWFDGMDVTTGWTQSGSQWTLNWDTPDFCNGHYYDLPFNQQNATTAPCTYADQYLDTTNPMSGDPQMVYIDGTYIHEVATKAEAVGNNFWYDQPNKQVVLGTNPAGHTVEVTKRPVALWIEAGPGNVKVRGLGFAHFATDNFPEAGGMGAILVNSASPTFENNAFVENAGSGLQVATAGSPGSIIRGNIFYHNGSLGMEGNGNQKTGGTDNMLIEGNVFDGNNTERFGKDCNYSCQAAGVKLAHMVGVTVQDNIFKNQVGVAHGWWCDMACSGAKIVRNVFENNGGNGIFYEISDTGIIASNLIIGNGTSGTGTSGDGSYGIKLGSANTKVYNNTLINNKSSAIIYDDDRAPNFNWGIDAGPSTTNVEFQNNIMTGSTATVVQSWRTSTASVNTGPNTFYSAYDYNSYFRSGTSPNISEWRDGTNPFYNSVAALLAAKGKEAHGQDITTGSDPFFVNLAGGDYHVRSSSVAYNAGTTLPADVAAAIGVSTTPVSRGAMLWPGSATSATPTPTATPGGDTTPPTVTLTAPAAGIVSGANVTLSANASDNVGVARVDFVVNTTVICADSAAPFTCGWNSTLVSDGNYTVTAKAYDAAGNMTATTPITVQVRNTATPTPTPAPLVGDINGDRKINVFDLSILLTKWGTGDASSDLNHDTIVNVFDLSIMLSHWTG